MSDMTIFDFLKKLDEQQQKEKLLLKEIKSLIIEFALEIAKSKETEHKLDTLLSVLDDPTKHRYNVKMKQGNKNAN